jgi:hypothetical protein
MSAALTTKTPMGIEFGLELLGRSDPNTEIDL